MRIFIAGATGVVGRRPVPLLRAVAFSPGDRVTSDIARRSAPDVGTHGLLRRDARAGCA
jgi:hypothetical protein